MKETNLNIFFQMGLEIGKMSQHVSTETTVSEFYTEHWLVYDWLNQFRRQILTLPFPKSQVVAVNIIKAFAEITKGSPLEWGRKLYPDEVMTVHSEFTEFGKALEQDHQNLNVFTVTPKGIYSTRLLIEQPENKFTENVRKHFPPQMLHDLREAGRSLAFELPTACAFHICRGTEALMLGYYELLAKHPWSFPKKDWKIYVEQLVKEGAPKTITSRLDEIRQMDRNAYIHPDVNVTTEEAPVLFELCTGVIFFMCQEMEKLKP